MNYSEKLQNPKWQRKRTKILNRDDSTCRNCGDKDAPLHVHHCYYRDGAEPWEYLNESLVTLCEDCHRIETANFHDRLDKFIMLLRVKGLTSFDLAKIMKRIGKMKKDEIMELFKKNRKKT